MNNPVQTSPELDALIANAAAMQREMTNDTNPETGASHSYWPDLVQEMVEALQCQASSRMLPPGMVERLREMVRWYDEEKNQQSAPDGQIARDILSIVDPERSNR